MVRSFRYQPLAVMLDDKQHKDWRLNNLEGLWTVGERLVRKAASIARCRNQTLLIYFATDGASFQRTPCDKPLPASHSMH
jgi:hypothetical protein